MTCEKDVSSAIKDSLRAETTLLLLMSVDGKITSGESDNLNSDRDWKRIRGVKEGIHQYYEIEWSIAINSLSSGRIMEKIGINSRRETPEKDDRLTFFIVDRKPHLNEHGVRYLAQWVGRLFIVTNNPSHPACALTSDYTNVEVIFYHETIDFTDLLRKMKQKYGITHLTVETGGTLNAVLLREGLIDHVIIVVAPLLVGGRTTSTLIDGPSLQTEEDLMHLKALNLVKCEVLSDSYIRLEYDVLTETAIDPEAC